MTRLPTTKARRRFKPYLLALLASVSLVQHAPPAAAEAPEHIGDLLRFALPAAAFGMTVRRDDPQGRKQFYRSFGASVLGTYVLKSAVDKERPDGTGDDAFPSGHAANAFQAAAFVQRRYGRREAWPFYALATYTAWTRVDADKHDTSDVLAGAALGIASSFVLTKRRDVAVSAANVPDGFGLRIDVRF
jgi:membrane-associated phospholipid phosphatase